MSMKEIQITYEQLFKIIELEENIQYELDCEYFQKTQIEILDEFGHWVKVNGLIQKKTNILKIELDVDKTIVCAKKHLVYVDDSIKYVDELIIGDYIHNANGVDYIITDIQSFDDEELVYDIEVDNDSHLYQCALGLVHHNTLLTSAIVKYANMLNMRTITIVPSSSLLKQTHDYIKQFEIPVGMFGGGKKDDAPNIVATWQTLQNNKSFIKDFECIIWDEVHGAKAFVAQQIMQQASNSYMRIGLTGTIPKDPMDKMNLTSGFGPVVYEVKAHELQKRNILSSIHINIFELLYPKEYINSFVDWADETNFLQSNPMFQEFIKTILGTMQGNTLILMKNIDPASELATFLGCTYISSKLNVDKRQEKFNEFIHGGNHIAVGTYSLLSTGIDIVHIHNLILAPTPGKSFTKTIQSIGRSLRRKDGQKEHANIIDLTSNLKFDKKHIKNRTDYYKEAKYPFETDKIDMTNMVIKPKKKK